jgi:hypothetical protein
MTICLFGHHGRTYTFKNVTIESDNETMLTFTYAAMSDGKTKRFVARKDALIGYAMSD